jgi:hypothetical protein
VNSPHDLLAFYSSTGTDDRDRSIDDVHSFSTDELERNHDFIQWLFPLFERSAANPSAPVLDEDAASFFRSDPAIRRRMRRSVEVMLDFYGLTLDQDGDRLRVSRAATFEERARVWLTRGNHNFLRLTRIMKSLSILGEAPLARAILAGLEEIAADNPGTVGETTLKYWQGAVSSTHPQ